MRLPLLILVALLACAAAVRANDSDAEAEELVRPFQDKQGRAGCPSRPRSAAPTSLALPASSSPCLCSSLACSRPRRPRRAPGQAQALLGWPAHMVFSLLAATMATPHPRHLPPQAPLLSSLLSSPQSSLPSCRPHHPLRLPPRLAMSAARPATPPVLHPFPPATAWHMTVSPACHASCAHPWRLPNRVCRLHILCT